MRRRCSIAAFAALAVFASISYAQNLGTVSGGTIGETGASTDASFNQLGATAVDANGNLYIADRRNRAIAIENKETRRGMIAQNALALGVPQLEIRAGSVPDALDGLPEPDAVFIGGGITTEGLIERCWQALKPGGRLVANVVTLEGESVLEQARRDHGGDLARFSVQRAEPVGRFHGWHAMMPVTQWSVTKE